MLYALKETVPTILELFEGRTLLFLNEQEKPNLSKAEIEIKFCLKDSTIKYPSKPENSSI